MKLEGSIQGKNYVEYAGLYHTDYTIRSNFFVPGDGIPNQPPLESLDLTYLYRETQGDEDFQEMTRGYE